MTDRYCVFGNPIAHSKSPLIHRLFAAATGQVLSYEACLAPLDGFSAAVAAFVAQGGRGANVTVPFKEEAFRLCDRLSPRAQRAGAVNTLVVTADGLLGDNTDGAGLVADVQRILGGHLAGQRVLLLGAGGAARGVIAPLMAAQIATLSVANRSLDKAVALAEHFADFCTVNACRFEDLAGQQFDLIINATSASLAGDTLPLPSGLLRPQGLAYDMMYGPAETPFLRQMAQQEARAQRVDGLGMLVEQAAEAFFIWRGVRPATEPVRAALRQVMAG